MHIFFDPVLIAVPRADNNPSEYALLQSEYASRLLVWKDEFRRKKHRFFMSTECIDALYQDDCFPEVPILKRCLSMAGILGPFSPQDIATVAMQLATNVPHLEDFFPDVNLQRIDVDDATFFIHPDLLKRLTPTVATAFKRSLARVTWLRTTNGLVSDDTLDPADLLLATHTDGNETITYVRADVLADDLVTVENELPLVTHPDDLARFTGLAELWNKPMEAIRWLSITLGNSSLIPYYVAPDFVESIIRYDYQNKPGWLDAIYNKCFQLLAGHQFEGSKQHRFGHPPKTYGSWVAWRLHITGRPSSIRLHYWRDENRIILMNVFSSGEHDEDEGMIAPPPPQGFL